MDGFLVHGLEASLIHLRLSCGRPLLFENVREKQRVIGSALISIMRPEFLVLLNIKDEYFRIPYPQLDLPTTNFFRA